ncbi:MAG TPA: hypothetical protein VG843_11995 [Rhizomicrobium sp.]|jgi:hypothetical protein|nr:hypothetical protein [Rhizomicrobium sp.]
MLRASTLALIAAGAVLGGCTQSVTSLSPDFGVALRQDIAAQIADPDAHYRGDPAPASNGARTSLSQSRYLKGQVIEPTSLSASNGLIGSQSSTDSGAATGSTAP